MFLPPLQFPLDSLPNEIGSALGLGQNSVNTGQSPLGESGWGLFVVDSIPTHFVDITY